MAGNEAYKTIKQYFSEDGVMQYRGNKKTVLALTELFATTKPIFSDAPDLYFRKDNLVLIIEHFEFDCYYAGKKGSSFRREEARIQRALETAPMTGNSLIMHDEIKGKASYEDYIRNLKKSFEEHYARIDTYINNLSDQGIIHDDTDVKVMFLIDDVSPLGAHVIDNSVNWGDNAVFTIELGCCREFLDLLSASPKVDYALACSSCSNNRLIWFINRHSIRDYYRHAKNYASMTFVPFRTQVISVQILIPKYRKWSEVLTIINGKDQKAVFDPNGAFPIYGSGGIIGRANDYLCEAGTTIVGRKGTINSPIFVNERFWNVDTAFGITPGSELLPKYLYYFCCHFNFKSLDKSTTIPSLAKRDLLSIEMPVPPLEEQARIVARIEELFSELDAGVDTLQKIKQQLSVYRQAVLKNAFNPCSDFVTFGAITESRLGKMLDKEKNTGTPRKYLRNINVRWFSFDLSDMLEMRIADDEVDKYSIQIGDLVICEGGEPGRCAVWQDNEPIFYQKALHRVRFTDDCNPEFYMYYLWHAAQTGRLVPYFTGTGIKHLTGQSLVKVPVPKVSRRQQDKIVSEIETRLSLCDDFEKTVDQALQQSAAMRQSILKQAFEGGLNE